MFEISSLITELFTAIDGKDAKGFGEFLTEDAEFRFGNHPPTKGKQSAIEAVDYFFNSIYALSHTIEAQVNDANSVICHGHVTYTRHDKSELTVPFCNWLYFTDDKISCYLIFADTSNL